jgi:hypothetical protein
MCKFKRKMANLTGECKFKRKNANIKKCANLKGKTQICSFFVVANITGKCK